MHCAASSWQKGGFGSCIPPTTQLVHSVTGSRPVVPSVPVPVPVPVLLPPELLDDEPSPVLLVLSLGSSTSHLPSAMHSLVTHSAR